MSVPLLRIGICDDEQAELERIKDELYRCLSGLELDRQWEISTFSDGRAMYEESLQRKFDLAFLDLEMPGWDGFDLAERLHMSSPETSIVFVSVHDSLVYQSFTHTPLWFVRKKWLSGEMTQAVQHYFRKTAHARVRYRLNEGIGYRELRIRDIRYIECNGHSIAIMTGSGGEYRKYGSLKAEEEELAKHGFIRVHKNYLVNVEWIDKVGNKRIVLKDGTELDMGRERRKTVMERVAQYGGEYG